MPADPPRPAGESAVGVLDAQDPASLLALGLEERWPVLPAGSVVAHYRVLKLVGRGGMGDVYAAEDTRLGRRVALKLIGRDLSDAEGDLRLEREARALAALNHPNIVTLYSLEDTPEARFLTLELVEGRTLDTLLDGEPLPLARVVEIGSALAAALAAAHAHGVLHRDLKPANVVLTADGGVKVLDFGLAKLLRPPGGRRGSRGAPSSVSGTIRGTAHYMSPEQVRGEDLDERSDLFSLGAVLYEMATGRTAFPGASWPEALEAVLRAHPPAPRSLRAEIPPALEAIILRCLKKSPARRFHAAAEVRTALDGLRESLSAPVPVARGAGGGRALRLPWRRALAGAALVAALALGYAWLRPGSGPPPPPAPGTRTVAVAPFEDLTGAGGSALLAAALTEDLATRLAQSPGLRVLTAPPGARRLSPEQLAGRYGVQAVVSGVLSRRAGSDHLTVHLVEPESGAVLWAASYDFASGDELTFGQVSVAGMVRDIRRRLLGDQEPGAPALAVRPEAYEHFLKGRYLWNRRHTRSLLKAVEELDESIRLDPGFAPAHAALADCYNILGSAEYGVLPPHEAMPRAREEALAALELDPKLAAAHAALGHVQFFYDWDRRRAEQSFRRALELDPGNATAHEWLSELLSLTGRLEEAEIEARKARELDPLSPILYVWLGNRHFYAGDYAAAMAPLEEALELDPGFVLAHLFLARTLQARGLQREAEAAYRQAMEVSDGNPAVTGFYGHFLASIGRRGEARQVLAKLEGAARERYVPAWAFGVIELGLGDDGKALDWLDRAAEERSGALVYVGAEPVMRPLAGNPRLHEILARTGLDPGFAAPVAGASAPGG